VEEGYFGVSALVPPPPSLFGKYYLVQWTTPVLLVMAASTLSVIKVRITASDDAMKGASDKLLTLF